MIDRIVLNIPHSSKAFPPGAKERWNGNIDAHIDRWRDVATDWLFSFVSLTDPRIRPVIFPWSRFFCDAERLKHDPLEAKGQGLAYTCFEECRRDLSDAEKREIETRWYDVHVENLRQELTQTSLLMDCHSFPPDLSDVEICIGVNSNCSRPDDKLLSDIRDIFSMQGYCVALNSPYSNSFAPKMPFRYPSVMIEVNKRTYLNEHGGIDPAKAERLRSALKKLYARILDSDNFTLYEQNFPMFYEQRERIWQNPRYFSSVVIKNSLFGEVSLGAILKAIDQYPQLFRYKDDELVYDFVGNPMTGTCSNYIVNIRNGHVTKWRGVSFLEKVRIVRKTCIQFPTSQNALPLPCIIAALRHESDSAQED